jgi:hypothetical protein
MDAVTGQNNDQIQDVLEVTQADGYPLAENPVVGYLIRKDYGYVGIGKRGMDKYEMLPLNADDVADRKDATGKEFHDGIVHFKEGVSGGKWMLWLDPAEGGSVRSGIRNQEMRIHEPTFRRSYPFLFFLRKRFRFVNFINPRNFPFIVAEALFHWNVAEVDRAREMVQIISGMRWLLRAHAFPTG